jgi:hypothetical protein
VVSILHVTSRHVIVTGMTAHPDGQWMAQQARNFHILTPDAIDKPKYMLHDHDTKFTKEFDAILKSEEIEVIKLGPRAPNLNAYAERWRQCAVASRP